MLTILPSIFWPFVLYFWQDRGIKIMLHSLRMLAYYGPGDAGPFLSLSFIFHTALGKATLYLYFLVSSLGSKASWVMAE